jgi:hypothetical protein
VKPTAYILIVIGLFLAVGGVFLSPTADQVATGGDGRPASLARSYALTITLFVAAGLAVAGGAALLWFGGKGYTETNVPPARGGSRAGRA